MNDIAFLLGGRGFTWAEAALAFAAFMTMMLLVMAWLLLRTRRDRSEEAFAAAERAREMDDKVAEMTRLQAELTGRMQSVAEIFGSRQSDFVRLIGERIDGLQHRVGQGLETGARQQAESLSRLNERLAVIDTAQKNLTDLTGEVVGLKDILSNKQTRGAYGQGRMEAIIRDCLPDQAYAFQPTLSNNSRPDCLLRLPGDERGLVIDAKFPLEAFTAFREAPCDKTRQSATARVKTDLGVHIKQIADKYFIPGETQDLALMFVPAESIYADIQEHFDEVVQRAHRARILIVSPSLLSLAIQVLQSLVRDARIRQEAQVIQSEVAKLLIDIARLGERVGKLDSHFAAAQKDIVEIKITTDKIGKRGEKIETMEFEDEGQVVIRPKERSLRAVE